MNLKDSVRAMAIRQAIKYLEKDPANNMTRSEKAAFDQFREKLSQYEQMDKNQPNAKILRNTLIRESGELIRRADEIGRVYTPGSVLPECADRALSGFLAK